MIMEDCKFINVGQYVFKYSRRQWRVVVNQFLSGTVEGLYAKPDLPVYHLYGWMIPASSVATLHQPDPFAEGSTGNWGEPNGIW